MSVDLNKLEPIVDREMSLLNGLPDEPPRPEVVARIAATVAAEAGRVRHVKRIQRLVGAVTGVAAALWVSVTIWPSGGSGSAASRMDADQYMQEWAAAWDESTSRVTGLLDGGWRLGGFGRPDDEAALEDLLGSFDESLDNFEAF